MKGIDPNARFDIVVTDEEGYAVREYEQITIKEADSLCENLALETKPEAFTFYIVGHTYQCVDRQDDAQPEELI